MKDFSFYEQAGIVLPGAVLLFGVAMLLPSLKPVFLGEGITVGGLGLFLVIAYALGHLVAAAGNILERIVWFRRGMPSDWIVDQGSKLIGDRQIVLLRERMLQDLSLDVDPVGMDRREWRAHFAHIYRDVMISSRVGRVEIFNGTYGLSRGLATASLLLCGMIAALRPIDWLWWSGGIAVCAGLFIFRMRRFGIHFAREVLLLFLLSNGRDQPKDA